MSPFVHVLETLTLFVQGVLLEVNLIAMKSKPSIVLRKPYLFPFSRCGASARSLVVNNAGRSSETQDECVPTHDHACCLMGQPVVGGPDSEIMYSIYALRG